jgi:hypothetical protein
MFLDVSCIWHFSQGRRCRCLHQMGSRIRRTCAGLFFTRGDQVSWGRRGQRAFRNVLVIGTFTHTNSERVPHVRISVARISYFTAVATTRVRLSLKESRIKLIKATNLDRKSGIRGLRKTGEAHQRSVFCSLPQLTCFADSRERSEVRESFFRDSRFRGTRTPRR